MRRSRVLEKLRKGQVALSISTSFTSSPNVAELAGIVGFDCLWIDTEHRPYDYDTVYRMIMGARSADTDCVVRIRKESYTDYFRFMEDGAAGIMVPHCKSVEDARFAVKNGRYPPVGARGIDGVGVDADYGLVGYAEHSVHANRETFIILQVEDREAVEHIDEIAAVEGFDLFLIGPQDLAASYGAAGNTGHSSVIDAIARVSEASSKHGKWWGIPAGNIEAARQYVGMGARFINAGSDRGVLANGFKKIMADFSALI